MTQISEQHERRQQYVESVGSSLTVNQEALAQALTARFAGMEGGAEAVAAALTLLTFERKLALSRLDALGAAELTLSREEGEDQDARAARDVPHMALLDYLERLRRRVDNDAGPAMARRLGLAKQPPNRFNALMPYAEAVVELCRAANVTLQDEVTGARYSTASLADAVAQRLGAYQQAAKDVSREQRETQAARAARDDAEAAFSQDVYAGAQVMEALYRQAGMVAQAERIRPNTRRVAGRSVADAADVTTEAATEAATDAVPSLNAARVASEADT